MADTAVALLAGRRVARPCPVTGRVPIGSAVPARVGLPVLARMRAHGDRRRGAQQAGQG